MWICLQKSTGKLIESQSDATPGSMIKNALQYGYAETDLEEKEVTVTEWKSLVDASISLKDKVKNELQSLDSVLPRCVEDLIVSMVMDETKLPQIMKDRLLRKRQLREQIKTL